MRYPNASDRMGARTMHPSRSTPRPSRRARPNWLVRPRKGALVFQSARGASAFVIGPSTRHNITPHFASVANPQSNRISETFAKTLIMPLKTGMQKARTRPESIPHCSDISIAAANQRGVPRFVQGSIPSSGRLRASFSGQQSSLTPLPRLPSRLPRSPGWDRVPLRGVASAVAMPSGQSRKWVSLRLAG